MRPLLHQREAQKNHQPHATALSTLRLTQRSSNTPVIPKNISIAKSRIFGGFVHAARKFAGIFKVC